MRKKSRNQSGPAAVGRCLRDFLGSSRGCLTRQPIDADFGLRTSGFIRYSAFGFAPSLASTKPSIYEGSFQNENYGWRIPTISAKSAMIVRPLRCLSLAGALLLGITADAQVRITEFMANNTRTLADADGDYSDWIEIHNPGTNTVNLENWFLTDDPAEFTKWLSQYQPRC
jgi:hypothetical protein